MTRNFSTRLLDWYDKNARDLPWRIPPEASKRGVLPDPYHVWLSEIMLQQTQVTTVRDYYHTFLQKWPSLADLARADEDAVMRAWAGLGYYSRARNLMKCASAVLTDHRGTFPDQPKALKALPGIGDYTSAAIAAIAFRQPVPVVDGNVERVFARLFKIETPLPKAKPEIYHRVEAHLDRSRPGDFAQACMDLGATLCLPKTPNCLICPLAQWCQSRMAGNPTDYPVKAPRKTKPTRTGAAFVAVNSTGAILLQKRPENGLLASMTAVPTSNWTSRRDGAQTADAAPFAARWNDCGTVHHTFTHFHLELKVWHATVAVPPPKTEGWWSDPHTLPDEALPTVMKKALEKAVPGSTRPMGPRL